MQFIQRPRQNGKTFMADMATIKLAAELAQNNNSLTARQKGVVYRTGHKEPWDMSKEWTGRELTSYLVRESLWARAKRVTYYYPVGRGTERAAEFFIELDNALTKEEVEMTAEAYMMALNARRAE